MITSAYRYLHLMLWLAVLVKALPEGKRVCFQTIVKTIPERDAEIFRAIAVNRSRATDPESSENLNDYICPIHEILMSDVIKNTIAYARGEKTEPIKAEMFWGMLHFAKAMDIEERWGKQLLINAIKYGLLSEANRESIAKYSLRVDSPSQAYITIKLLFEFLHLFGIHFRVVLDNGRRDLLIGCNHACLLHECRDMWKYPEIENNPNSTFYRAFKNVIMHCSPFLIHDADRNVKMTLLTLIGMIPGGRHVIAADCETWPVAGGFRKVIETIRTKGGEMVGISGVRQTHRLIADGSLSRYFFNMCTPEVRKIEYLDAVFYNLGEWRDYEKLIAFILKICPVRITLQVTESAFPQMGDILIACENSIVEDLNISGIEAFRKIYKKVDEVGRTEMAEMVDAMADEIIANMGRVDMDEFREQHGQLVSKIVKSENIRHVSYSNNMFEPFFAARDLRSFIEYFGDKLNYVFAGCQGVVPNEKENEQNRRNTAKLAAMIRDSKVETFIYRLPHDDEPLAGAAEIFATILQSKHLKTLVVAIPRHEGASHLLWEEISNIEAAIESVENLGDKRIVIAVETACSLGIVFGRVPRVRSCTHNTYYELYPNKDERLEYKKLKTKSGETCRPDLQERQQSGF